MNLEVVLDTNICRACMKQGENMTPMYDDNPTDLSYKLAELTSIQIDKFDGMPNMLCSECINYTYMLYNFKLQVQKSDKTLRMMFQKEDSNKSNDKSSGDQIDKTTINETGDEQLDNFVICQMLGDKGKNKSNLQLENIHDFVAKKIREGKIDAKIVKHEIPAEMTKLLESQDIAIVYVQPNSPISYFQLSEIKNNSDLFDSIAGMMNEQKNNTESLIKSTVRKENNKYSKEDEETMHIAGDIGQSGNANDSSDSDSDYLDNILGSVSDVVTRIKEIKLENITEYQCTFCMESYKELPDVLLHIVNNHVPRRGPFYCVLCERDCDSLRELRIHVKTHSGACPYTCFMCDKAYSRKRYLKRHMVCHDFPRYRCQKCGQRFKTKPELDSHVMLHVGRAPFTCNHCSRVFNYKAHYKRHLTTHLDPDGHYIPKFACKHCDKRFLNNRTLETHMRIHTGEKPFSCEHCKKAFSQKGNLLSHIKCHLNLRNYTCEVCGKRFNQRSTLKDHSLLHTGEKPYVCTMCGKAFTVSAALRRHIYYHVGKPLQCEHCDMKFVGQYDLRRHMRVHEKKKAKWDPEKYKTRSKANKSEEQKEKSEEESVVEDAKRETVYVEELLITQQDFTQIVESRQVESEKENENALFNLHSNNSILYTT